MNGVVFDLKRYALHDGPGIRTTVFLKGCPLDCPWCHNPESKAFGPEIDFLPGRCIRCGECMVACPEHVALPGPEDGALDSAAACRRCFQCVDACPSGARVVVGRAWSTVELVRELEKDRPFFEESGGGITFSGGEPLMQPDFLLACLRLCSERGMHTAVDTCGYAPAEAFLRVLPFTGLFLYDLKIMDPQRHEAIVGVGNAGILDNLRLIHAHDARIHVRIPLVPGITDSEENLSAAGAFVRDELDAEPPVHILPYHAMAQEKYRRRGLEPAIIDEPDAGAVAKARGVLEAHGLKVFVGG